MSKIRRRIANSIYKPISMETHFNVPIKFFTGGYVVNERIIEGPFVFSELGATEKTLKILDFGCTRSTIPISLASLGHDVYCVDLRDYPFSHKRLRFIKKNFLDFKESGFDAIYSVSVIEHVGLGAYGEKYDPNALVEVLGKMNSLLNEQGRLIITVPCGKPSIDNFMRSFSPDEIETVVANAGFLLEKALYYKRKKSQEWLPCDRGRIEEVSNSIDDRKNVRSGVVGLGCLTFCKSSSAHEKL